MRLKSDRRHTDIVLVIVIYVCAIFAYCMFASFFTIPVHLSVDEELYISMAKSFHFDGCFMHDGQIVDYSCYLYSLIISLAYYWYSPERILFLFRCIGVFIMLSSIFPVYLFANKMLYEKKLVWIVTILAVMMPSMADTAFCMQETFAYPVAMWAFYLIYLRIKSDDQSKFTNIDLLIVIASCFGFFIKTYLIFIPVSYILFVLLYGINKKDNTIIRSLLIVFGFSIGYAIGKMILLYINGGRIGVNHYDNQIMALFPIDMHTIISIGSCLLFYLVSLVFYWGVFPIVLAFLKRKEYDKYDGCFFSFFIVSLLILLVEIVVTIVVTEEGKPILPHKFIYRYFQIMEVPMLCLFLKIKGKVTNYGKSVGVFVLLCILMTLNFVFRGYEMKTAIIDAPIFLLIENATKYCGRIAGGLLCVGIMICGVVLYMKYKENVSGFISSILKIGVIAIVLFAIIDVVQLPYYVNIIADGTDIEQDACSLENYISMNNITNVYYVTGSSDRYERAVYAYLDRDVLCIRPEDIEKFDEDNSLFIKALNNDEVKFTKPSTNLKTITFSY